MYCGCQIHLGGIDLQRWGSERLEPMPSELYLRYAAEAASGGAHIGDSLR